MKRLIFISFFLFACNSSSDNDKNPLEGKWYGIDDIIGLNDGENGRVQFEFSETNYKFNILVQNEIRDFPFSDGFNYLFYNGEIGPYSTQNDTIHFSTTIPYGHQEVFSDFDVENKFLHYKIINDTLLLNQFIKLIKQ